jgi:hypothetical protein
MTIPTFALVTDVNADGFTPGKVTFQNGVTCVDCGNGTSSPILDSPVTLDLTGISASSFTPLDGVLFAIDVGICSGTGTCGSSGNPVAATGWIDVSVPAPAIGHGLPVLLAVGGLLFGAFAWERSKKRSALETGMPQAA